MVAAVALLGSGRIASAESVGTPISGRITNDSTWTLAGSPYTLQTTVEIASGVTLTVQPGVLVQGEPFTSIFVRPGGHLVAIGTPSQPITFTGVVELTPSGEQGWQGIYVNWDPTGATGTAQLDNAIIGNAGTALEGPVDGLLVTNTQIHDNSLGMSVYNRLASPPSTISENVFLNNRKGLFVENSFHLPITVEHNDFWHNQESIGLHGLETRVNRNDFIPVPGAEAPDVTLASCGGGSCSLDLTENWWGTTDMTVIEHRVLDGNDDSSRLIAIVDPPATAEQHPSWPPAPETHPRSVTLRISRSNASGAVSAEKGMQSCESLQTALIQRHSGGGWETIGETRTDTRGRYSVAIQAVPGTYRALVELATLGDPPTDVCLEAVSTEKRVR
jgi:hypothetical protein